MTQQDELIQLLKEATNAGLKLWVEEGKLKFAATRKLEEGLRSRIAASKDQLILLLGKERVLLEDAQAPAELRFPVLPMQADILKSISLAEVKSHYNVPLILRYTGALSLERFETALRMVVAQNLILSTKFVQEGEQYFHVVESFEISDYLEFLDLSEHLDSTEIFQRYCFEFTHQVLAVENGPLFKVVVVKKAEREFYICFLFHHAIFDGLSGELLIEEFNKAYHQKDYSKNLQYSHFVKWYLNEGMHKQQQDKIFWSEEISKTQKLNFSYDFEQPEVLSHKGASIKYKVDLALSEKLERLLSKTLKVTPFNFFLSVYALFLRDYCNQSSICIGIPTTLRHTQELQSIIGMFVNSLPLLLDVDSSETFNAFLGKVSEKVRNVVSHNALCAQDILKIRNQKSDPGITGLFQTMFLYEENSLDAIDFCEGTAQYYVCEDSRISKFDLTLSVTKVLKGFYQLEFEYSTELFLPGTIDAFLKGYVQLLTSIVELPLNEPIAKLSVMSVPERDLYLKDFNLTAFLYEEKSVVELFLEQVKKNPAAVAVAAGKESLSYQALDAASSQLAKYLVKTGNQNKIVGINITRSLHTLTAILGVLKAGSCYVPIDPEYPNERLQHIVKDSKAALIIVNNETAHREYPIDILNIDNFSEDTLITQKSPQSEAFPQVELDSPAYVIYTSGSTGQPKGVLIEHRSLSHYIQWSVQEYIQNKGSGSLVHSSLAFDLTVTSLFAPLCCGKSVFMVPDNEGVDGLVYALKERQDYSLIKITPAHLKILQHTLSAEILANISATFVIGGEALYLDDLNKLLMYCKKAVFINEYGPTETTVGAMNFSFNSFSVANIPRAIPIGKPIPNYKIYLLDHLMRPVPPGVIGEIYISGIGLARGYLDRPELNQERFVRNPYAEDSFSLRLYKTGDLAKFIDFHTVHYVGRIDEQIKLNGYRIELGEIESCLLEISNVLDAIALVETVEGKKQIIAYLTTDNFDSLDIYTFKKAAADKLPFYMRPAQYRVVSSVPLTVNGKVDRKKLTALPFSLLSAKHEVSAGIVSSIQKKLLLIWQDVFKGVSLDLDSDFFALGGESLGAMRLVAKVKELGYLFSAKDLYKFQNIRSIGDYLEKQQHQHSQFESYSSEGEIKLTPIQAWFFEQNFVNPNYYLQVLPVEIRSLLSIQEVQQIIDQLSKSFDVFRVCFAQKEKEVSQYYAKEPRYGYHFLSKGIDALAFQEVEAIYQQIKVFNSPLIHILHLQEEGRFPILVFIAHHLVVDGYSWGVIKNGLQNLLSGNPIKPTINYKTWSQALNKYAVSVDHLEKKHWQIQADLIRLNTFEKGISWQTQGKVYEVSRTLSLYANNFKGLNYNLGDILLAVLFKTLNPFYKSSHIPITIESYGRADLYSGLDTSNSIGWFTSFYPVNIPAQCAGLHAASCIRVIKDLRDEAPNLGIGYLLSKNIVLPTVCFNYLGNISELTENKLVKELVINNLPLPVDKKNVDHFGVVVNIWEDSEGIKLHWRFREQFLKGLSEFEFIAQFESFFEEMTSELKGDSYQAVSEKMRFTPYYSSKAINLFDDLDIEAVYSALPGQSLMFRQYKNNSDSSGFRSQAYWKTAGKANLALISATWKELYVKIHALRVVFVEQNFLYQVERAPAQLPITFLNYDEPFFSGHFDRALTALVRGQFKLEGDCLFRVIILQYHDCFVQVFDHHHALLDGVSVRLIKNLVEDGLTNQRVPALENLKGNRDYFSHSKSAAFKAKMFWREYLKGYQGVNPLPDSKKEVSFFKPVDIEGSLELGIEKISTKVLKTAEQLKVNVNSIFEYAWSKTLSKALLSPDVAFGVISSGRGILESPDSYVGMFMNIVPVRVSFKPELGTDYRGIQKLHQDMQEIAGYDGCFSLQELEGSQEELLPGCSLINTLYTFENVDGYGASEALNFRTITNSPLTLIVKWGVQPSFVLAYDEMIFDNAGVKKLASLFMDTLKNILEPEIFKSNEVSHSLSEELVKVFNPEATDANPLVLVHGALSGYEVFNKLIPQLNRQVIAIDSYNLNKNFSEKILDIEVLAEMYFQLIKNHIPSKAFSIAGFSQGGLIVNAMLKHAMREGVEVEHVIMLDSFLLTSEQKEQRALFQSQFIERLESKHKTLVDFYDLNRDEVLKLANIELQGLLKFEACQLEEISLHLVKAVISDPVENPEYQKFINLLCALPHNGWERIFPSIKVYRLPTHHFGLLHDGALEVAGIINKILLSEKRSVINANTSM